MNEAASFRLRPKLELFAKTVANLPPSQELNDKLLRDLYDQLRECAALAHEELREMTGAAPEEELPVTLSLPVQHLPSLPPPKEQGFFKRLFGK